MFTDPRDGWGLYLPDTSWAPLVIVVEHAIFWRTRERPAASGPQEN